MSAAGRTTAPGGPADVSRHSGWVAPSPGLTPPVETVVLGALLVGLVMIAHAQWSAARRTAVVPSALPAGFANLSNPARPGVDSTIRHGTLTL